MTAGGSDSVVFGRRQTRDSVREGRLPKTERRNFICQSRRKTASQKSAYILVWCLGNSGGGRVRASSRANYEVGKTRRNDSTDKSLILFKMTKWKISRLNDFKDLSEAKPRENLSQAKNYASQAKESVSQAKGSFRFGVRADPPRHARTSDPPRRVRRSAPTRQPGFLIDEIPCCFPCYQGIRTSSARKSACSRTPAPAPPPRAVAAHRARSGRCACASSPVPRRRWDGRRSSRRDRPSSRPF
jgi:hypothetical protein